MNWWSFTRGLNQICVHVKKKSKKPCRNPLYVQTTCKDLKSKYGYLNVFFSSSGEIPPAKKHWKGQFNYFLMVMPET